MAEVSELSLQLHEDIKIVRHIFTVFSILFAIPAISVVILCSKRVSKRYSVMLGVIILLGVASDIVLQLVWDPLVLLPETCMLRESLILSIPGGPNLYHELWCLIIDSNIPVYSACFVERHQIINLGRAKSGIEMEAFSFPVFARHISTALIYLSILCLLSLLRIAAMSSEEEHLLLQSIKDLWPGVDVANAKCYDYQLFILFISLCVAGLAMCVVVTTLICWHTFAVLRKGFATMSDRKRAFNASMTKVLIIQATVPLAFIVFPFIFSLIAIIARVGGPLPYSLCYLFIAAHSATHSLVLLTDTPMYRKKFVEVVQRITGRRHVRKISVRSIVSFTT